MALGDKGIGGHVYVKQKVHSTANMLALICKCEEEDEDEELRAAL